MRARSAEKDSGDSSVAGSSAHDNSDNASRRRGAMDVKDIHPVNRDLSLKIKRAFKASLIINGFVESSDAVQCTKGTKEGGECILSSKTVK